MEQLPSIWVDEWLENWEEGEALIRRTIKQGTPGLCSTGGDYYFRVIYHVYPSLEMVVHEYCTSAEFFYCPGCGSFIRDGDWPRHQEFCRMESVSLNKWVAEHRECKVACKCGLEPTIEEIAAAGWSCPACQRREFKALW